MTATDTYRPLTGTDLPAPAAVRTRVMRLLGGRRGIVDGGLPPLLFVAVHAVARAQVAHELALTVALAAATAAATVIVVVRLFRREPLRQVLAGLAGLAVAAGFALASGEARGFFLPGIYVDAAYAVGFAVSALAGRPLVGTIYGLLAGSREGWRHDARLRRVFGTATYGWALVFTVRAGAQALLYAADRPGLLAVGKLVLGWPLTAAAVLITLALVGRATAHRAP